MAQAFAAVVLVCLASVPPEACTEDNAVEVRSTIVDSELRCTMGWQEIIAHEAEPRPGDAPTYLKTACRRLRPKAG